jgi:hypothetical protein
MSDTYESLAAARQVLIRAENECWREDAMGPAWRLVVHAKAYVEDQMMSYLRGGANNGN